VPQRLEFMQAVTRAGVEQWAAGGASVRAAD